MCVCVCAKPCTLELNPTSALDFMWLLFDAYVNAMKCTHTYAFYRNKQPYV